jgi:hypothetical protein
MKWLLLLLFPYWIWSQKPFAEINYEAIPFDKDSLPPLPPAPQIKRGWVGSFTYVVRLRGSGNQPKPYWYQISQNRTHGGYIELTSEIKGAIRVNQPDKNNAERWESWIPTGTKRSWNLVNDSLHAFTVITSDACCRTPHDHFNYVRAGDARQWKEGRTHGYDLQIDRINGSFILSAPQIECEAELRDIWKVDPNVKAQKSYLRDVDEKKNKAFLSSGYLNNQDTLMGSITAGQKEISIKRTMPIEFREFLWHESGGKNLYIEPRATGVIEFTLSIRRVGN